MLVHPFENVKCGLVRYGPLRLLISHKKVILPNKNTFTYIDKSNLHVTEYMANSCEGHQIFILEMCACYVSRGYHFGTEKSEYALIYVIIGEEVVSGSQRIHSHDLLLERISECGIDNDNLKGFTETFLYVSRSTNILSSSICRPCHPNIANCCLLSFCLCCRYGAPPRGGFGAGLERVVMLYCGLPNVRMASLFPRDPQRLTP